MKRRKLNQALVDPCSESPKVSNFYFLLFTSWDNNNIMSSDI